MYEPGYLRLLASGELEERVEKLYALLRACTVCPRDCGNDRLAGVLASCASGADPVVSSHTPHFGEEPFLSGTRGAGNVFFGNCNLRCVYCQNWQISQSYAGAASEHGHRRAPRRDAALAPGPRLPQHRVRFADALRAADGEGGPARGPRRA